jgi:porin
MWRALALFTALALPATALAEEAEPDGVALEIAYTADLLAGGGDPAYVDNLDLVLDWRSDRTQVHLYALYNNGADFSGTRYPRGWVASNIETGTPAVRLYEAWIEQSLADDKLSLRAGLYDLNSEFDALDAAGLFINPAHGIGTDFSQSGLNGPSIFPVTSLAVRVQYRIDQATTLRAAVLDGVPGDPTAPRRTAIKLGRGDGALLVGEVDRTFGDWRLIAGYWRYTAPFDDLLETARAGVPTQRRGAQGAYLRGEGLIAGAKQGSGLDAFFRLDCAGVGRLHAVPKIRRGLPSPPPVPAAARARRWRWAVRRSRGATGRSRRLMPSSSPNG